MADNILRLPAVIAATGLSRSTIYARIDEGTFPRQISLGRRAVGWLESEIDAWIVEQTERSRGTRHQSHDHWSPRSGSADPGTAARRSAGRPKGS